MGEEIAFQTGRISAFQGLFTLTLRRVILHTVMHHSSTSTYVPNFIEIKETFCGRTGGRTFETHLLGRLGGVDLIIGVWLKEWLFSCISSSQHRAEKGHAVAQCGAQWRRSIGVLGVRTPP